MRRRTTTAERDVVAAILQGPASSPGVCLWKNPRGVAQYPDGSSVAYGLAEGAADLVGLVEVRVLPSMVGRKLGVFVGLEVKRPGEKPRPDQLQWLACVRRFGGLGFWADDARIVEQRLRELREGVCDCG